MSSDRAQNETKEAKTKRLIEQAATEIRRFVESSEFGVLQLQIHLSHGQIDSLRVSPEKSYK